MSAQTMPVPSPDVESDVTPEPVTVSPRPFYGLPYNPADPTVAGSVALAFQMINRKRGLAS